MNSTWLITSELANQRARKVLFTCVVYTNSLYLPPAVFNSKSASGAEQMNEINVSNKHNIFKNPYWPEANLAIYECRRGFELGATEKQIQVVVSAGLEPRPLDRGSDTLTTRSRCLLASLFL